MQIFFRYIVTHDSIQNRLCWLVLVMSTLVVLFYTEPNYKIMVSNYIKHKNIPLNHFKLFILSWNSNALRENLLT